MNKIKNGNINGNGEGYSRNWNTEDIMGKYHLNRIENSTPVPGTQIVREQEHIKQKMQSIKDLEKSIEIRNKEMENKIHTKNQLAVIKARVYTNIVIITPILKIEKIIDQKSICNNPDLVASYADSEINIQNFLKHIEKGDHRYISFSILSGFKSINYQEEEYGNTALHIAVRMGYAECVRELLAYKIDPDIKNRLGNTAAHNSWLFWRNPRGYNNEHLSKEDRLKQEEKTCKMLSLLLNYKAYVDTQDSKGCTVLHTACRLGPIQAVISILGYKANHNIPNYNNQLPIDITKNEEIKKILLSWNAIRKEINNVDFRNVWVKFIRNYENSLTVEKTAQDMMDDFDLKIRIKNSNKSVNNYIVVDDYLLTKNYITNNSTNDNNNNNNSKIITPANNTNINLLENRISENSFQHGFAEKKIPKPWEEGWKEFAEKVNNEKERMMALTNENQRIEDEIDSKDDNDKMIIMYDNNSRNEKSDIDSQKTKVSLSNSNNDNNNNDNNKDKIVINIQKVSINKNEKEKNKQNEKDFSENNKVVSVLERRKKIARAICSDSHHVDTTIKSSLSSVLLYPKRIKEKTAQEKGEIFRLKDSIYNHLLVTQNNGDTLTNSNNNYSNKNNYGDNDNGSVIEKDKNNSNYKNFPINSQSNNQRLRFIEAELLPPLFDTHMIDNKKDNEKNNTSTNLTNFLKNERIEKNDTAKDDTKDLKNIFYIKTVKGNETIIYGKGRLTSSYNSSIPLQDPWQDTRSGYKPIMGDRTA